MADAALTHTPGAFRDDKATLAARRGTSARPDTKTMSPQLRSMPNVVFETLTDHADILALENEWNALFDRSALPGHTFQAFPRLAAWLRIYAAGPNAPQPLVIVARTDERTVLIAPFAVQKRLGLKSLTWMGEPTIQYGDILAEDTADRNTLCQRALEHAVAVARPDVIQLRRVRETAIAAPALANKFAVSARDAAPYFDLATAPDAATYEKRYSKKARRNRARMLSRLAQAHELTFHVYPPGREAAKAARAALSMKRAWLNHRSQVSPALFDSRIADWFDAIAMDPAAGCRISEMRCDGEIAASQISLREGNRLTLFLIVFNLAYEKDGVGSLHIEQTIRECYDEGIREVDFLGPDVPYKRRWTDGAVAMADYVAARTLFGRLYVEGYVRRLRPWAKALLQAMPQPVRDIVNTRIRR